MAAVGVVLASAGAVALDVGPELVLAGSALAPYSDALTPGHATSGYRGRIAVAATPAGYAVAWSGADGAIHAVALGRYGEPLGVAPVRVGENGHSPSISCASDSCLVVWRARDGSTDAFGNVRAAIFGARLSHGMQLLDASPIRIAVYPEPAAEPARDRIWQPIGAQSDTDGASYYVTYISLFDAPGCYTLWGRTLTSAGTLGAPSMLDQECDWGYPLEWAGVYDGDYFVALQWWDEMPRARWPTTVLAYSTGRRFMNWDQPSPWWPIEVASGGPSTLVLFNSYDYELHDDVASLTRNTLRAAWVGDQPVQFTADNTALLQAEPPAASAGGYPVVGAFDGQQYLAVWWTRRAYQPADVLGALLPVELDPAVGAQPLFSSVSVEPALASAENGTALLLYAAPSAADPAVDEVRGRVVFTDSAPPIVTVPASIAAIASSAGGATISFAATAHDDHAGILQPTCSRPSGSMFPPGTTHVTCTAVDPAGNAGFASFDVTVTFQWSGVRPPVRPDGASVFRAGRTVPVKFRLAGASAGISDLQARLFVSRMTAVLGRAEEEASSTRAATVGNLFRFDGEQYVFNLKVASGTWRVTIDLGDGVDRSVLVSATE
ncbi:PxKF domain-containing protein [Anaeromyxobacter dehalogenans]|uniref:PxKF domain-containing protein n=1 Tax=Anaeromyxobacter dehalogenans TaxID=161493 RepID=UPI001FDEC6C8|nr:PxKF domain-containing protein [Anaeromyxobacter dehalogenans]